MKTISTGYLPLNEINRLLSLKKEVISSPEVYRLSFANGKSKHGLLLRSFDNNNELFLLSIKRSEKILLKVSFHHMRKNDRQFLFREWSGMSDPEHSLQGIVDKISETINLTTKIIYDPNLL